MSRGALVLIIVLAFSAFGLFYTPPERDSDGKVHLVYWTGWTGHELEVQRRLVDRFNATHPDIEVKILSVAGSYQKVRIAFAGGSTPDVCSAIWATELSAYAMRGVLTPLDTYMAESGRSGDEFMPAVWRMLNYEGRPYGLCATTNSVFIVYNKDIYRRCGLDPDNPPKTLAELDRAAEMTTAYNPDGSFKRYGFRPGSLDFWAYVFGGGWYDEKTGRITANHPKNVEALRWMRSYAEKYDINRMEVFEQTFGSNQTISGPFFVGKMVMWTTGEWAEEHIRRYAPDVDWGYFPAPAPPGGRERTCSVGGSVFVIPKACRHKKEAWEFLSWMCGPEAVKEFCLNIGNIPPLAEVAAEPEFQEHDLYRFAVELAGGENAFGPPPVPIWPQYAQEIARAEDYAMHGRRDPQEVLDEVQRKMERELARTVISDR
jgi:ABC-type glycerol-3-phosphate transport system substrate-binding protein